MRRNPQTNIEIFYIFRSISKKKPYTTRFEHRDASLQEFKQEKQSLETFAFFERMVEISDN